MDSSIFSDMAASVTKKYTKQRKAEERHESARYRRREAMLKTRKITKKDAAYEYMETAYLKASANNTLPAAARQIMYAARGYIQDRTQQQLDGGDYFRDLLVDYMLDHPTETADWNVVFDARGNFLEPHTDIRVPLGTLDVRSYLRKVDKGADEDSLPELSTVYQTAGPENRYSAVLFIEKEGFLPLLQKVQLAEKYDISVMSTKGMSVTAARQLVDSICADVPLLIVRDFDKAGFSIASTIQKDSKRHTFKNNIQVIDLGLRLEDAMKWGLESESVSYRGAAYRSVTSNLRENDATDEEIDFLVNDTGYYSRCSGQRIELNAFTSGDFVSWLEEKLEENGIEKVIPDDEILEVAYRRAYRLRELQKVIDERAEEIEEEAEALELPDDLGDQIAALFDDDPTRPWDEAIVTVEEEADHAQG